MSVKLYEQLAADLLKAISEGVTQAGERLPSIRQLAQSRRLSVTTVRHAYVLLESRGAIECRPQAGYFVRAVAPRAGEADAPLPAKSTPEPVPADVDISRLVLHTLKAIQSRKALPLGSPYPDPSLFPWRRLQRHSNDIAKRFKDWNAVDDIPPGNAEMIRQIARRHLQCGLDVDPTEIVVTVGATEAINLCLQAVAKTGDTIAVESPTFYVMLQAIERMGMRAVELPTDPTTGIDLDALRRLMQRQRIDACLAMPNFQNPLGFTMPDAQKKAFVALAEEHDMPIVENGVYNELHFGDTPPTTLKHHDRSGLVLHCGSFSKSLTAGVRIGWALCGRYRQRIETLKFLNTLATPAVPQLAVASYLMRDGWDHHLRFVRQTLAQRMDILRGLVQRHFPAQTRISRPAGGYLVWIEMPASVDSMDVYREALERGITIAPGRIFSNSDLYRNFMRLNCSYESTTEIESAVRTVGAIVHQAVDRAAGGTRRAAA